MEPRFTMGDKVRLVSGGPTMTIRGQHYDVLSNEYRTEMFDCIWFAKDKEGNEKVHYCPFNADELVKADESNAG